MIEIIVLALFLLIPLYIGFYSANIALPTSEDYFVQNRSMGALAVFFTVASTWWSAMAFLGTGGFFYELGIGFWAVAPHNLLFGFAYYFIGKRVWYLGKRFNYITPGDIFADYYEKKILQQLVAVVSLIFTVPYLQIQLMGAGYIVSTLTSGMIPFWLAGLLFYGVIIVYVWVGGIRAVALTDIFYGVLIFVGLLLGGFWIVDSIGGVSILFQKMGVQYPSHLTLPGPQGTFNYFKVASMVIVMGLGGLMTLPMWLRMYCVKKESTFRYTAVFLSVITIGYLGTMFAAFSGLLLKPDLVKPDTVFPVILIEYTPSWLAAIILSAAAAAAMSTSNSQIHAISTIVSIDIYKNNISGKVTHDKLVGVGRIALVVFSGLAYIMALYSPSLLMNLGLMAMSGTLQLFPGLMGILFWRKATAAGTIMGLIGGCITVALFTFIPLIKNIVPIHAGLWGLIINFIIFYLVSLKTKPPSKSTMDNFANCLSELNN